MIEASCHCGAVTFEIANRPEQLTSCNCSLCHRLGTLWAYYSPARVRIFADPAATVAYVQGDRSLRMFHCSTCGCTTHWLSVDENVDRMAVNARLMPKAEIADIPVRHFDGAVTWQYLD